MCASIVKAILFDLFETLVTESQTSPARASSLGPELGCEPEDFRAQWKARRPAVTAGCLSLRQALAEITTGLGRPVEDATLRRVCEERVLAKKAPFERIEPQVLNVVGNLRSRGIRLGVVSNCFAEDVAAWPQCSDRKSVV